ncbi:hypothetical protein FSP39_018353, partial [Pinctada imbricata]
FFFIYHKSYLLMNLLSDPRTDTWFLMSSPLPTVVIVTIYLVIVYMGQRLMKDRQPFVLKDMMMCYNFCLVLLNAYISYEIVVTTWLNPKFSKICQPMDFSDDPYAIRLANACWWFYFSKIIELMDTVFFVLRKKNNQISFLHVYHHSTMPVLWWIGVKFVPGGESYQCASINSAIHVLMYTYYFLAAMGPHMQKFLWWKKYMTTLQLIQFWWIFAHTIQALYVDCNFPRGYGYALLIYDLSHILLFSNFYYQTYSKKARAKKEE